MRTKIYRFFKKIDLFGVETRLRIKNERKHKTACGGFLSLILSCLCFAFFFFCASDMIFSKNPASFISEIYDNNPLSISFSNQSNFFIFGVLDENMEHFIDSSFYDIKFQNQISEKKENEVMTHINDLKIERCSFDHFPQEQKLKQYFNVSSKFRPENLFCIKKELLENLKIEGSVNSQLYSSLYFKVDICNNKTFNNSCKTTDEIKRKLIYFAIYSADYLIDPNDFISPGIKVGKDYLSHLTFGSKVINNRFMSISEIKSEEGWLFSDLISYKFPSIKQDKDVFILNSDKTIFEMTIKCNISKTLYTRIYKNLAKVLAESGGLIQIMTILFFFINYPFAYNKYLLKIINTVFNFELNEEEKKAINAKKFFGLIDLSLFKLKNSPLLKSKKNLKLRLSFWSLICPVFFNTSREERIRQDQFLKASHRIKSKLNFTTMLQKFMEIDKLKMILLDKNQYQLFEYLPKPTVLKNCKINFNNGSQDINNQMNQIFDGDEIDNVRIKREQVLRSLKEIQRKKNKNEIDLKLLHFTENDFKKKERTVILKGAHIPLRTHNFFEEDNLKENNVSLNYNKKISIT